MAKAVSIQWQCALALSPSDGRVKAVSRLLQHSPFGDLPKVSGVRGSLTASIRLSRNYAVESGERDRPGRTSRRLADWERTANRSLIGDRFGGGQVFDETPNTATETVALPILTELLTVKRMLVERPRH